LKDKHFVNFFSVFQFSEKIYTPFQTDLYRLTSQSVGTIFAGKKLVFSIYFCFTEKLKKSKKKKHQTIDRVALARISVFFSVAFQLLFSFSHTCKKLMIINHHFAKNLS